MGDSRKHSCKEIKLNDKYDYQTQTIQKAASKLGAELTGAAFIGGEVFSKQEEAADNETSLAPCFTWTQWSEGHFGSASAEALCHWA